MIGRINLAFKSESLNRLIVGFLSNSNTSASNITGDIASGGGCYIETDMRAMQNPTRMQIIKEVCLKLINKLHSVCPECNYPGFGVVGAQAGLLCNSCSMPTRSTSAHIYQCKHCHYESKVLYPNGKESEDPMYCDFCNP